MFKKTKPGRDHSAVSALSSPLQGPQRPDRLHTWPHVNNSTWPFFMFKFIVNMREKLCAWRKKKIVWNMFLKTNLASYWLQDGYVTIMTAPGPVCLDSELI